MRKSGALYESHWGSVKFVKIRHKARMNLSAAVPQVEHHSIVSYDGTSIAYQAFGQGPAVVFANGLGGDYAAWRYQFHLLGASCRLISWDYRGLYRSGRPDDFTTLSVAGQVEDLRRILQVEGISRALFLGWSMGVQFNFEYARLYPQQMIGIIALNGTYGHPFRTAFGLPLFDQLIPAALSMMGKGAPWVARGAKLATHWSGLIPVLTQLGAVAPTLDRQVFSDLAQQFSGLDFEVYAEMMRYLGRHNARDVLPTLSMPVLILAGANDVMTPISTAHEMEELIPHATLKVIPGGTHYTAVEYPKEVNDAIVDFCKSLNYAGF